MIHATHRLGPRNTHDIALGDRSMQHQLVSLNDYGPAWVSDEEIADNPRRFQEKSGRVSLVINTVTTCCSNVGH